jgi:hypothetical protein
MTLAVTDLFRRRTQIKKAHNFCADVRREIAGRAFTIGARDIPLNQIEVPNQDTLESVPVEGHPGVAHVWVRCSVRSDPSGSYWLRVKTVDGMIMGITIGEVTAETPQPTVAELPLDQESPNP